MKVVWESQYTKQTITNSATSSNNKFWGGGESDFQSCDIIIFKMSCFQQKVIYGLYKEKRKESTVHSQQKEMNRNSL